MQRQSKKALAASDDEEDNDESSEDGALSKGRGAMSESDLEAIRALDPGYLKRAD